MNIEEITRIGASRRERIRVRNALDHPPIVSLTAAE
jgi:hypothetical protein